jgi:hypothetical protein
MAVMLICPNSGWLSGQIEPGTATPNILARLYKIPTVAVNFDSPYFGRFILSDTVYKSLAAASAARTRGNA